MIKNLDVMVANPAGNITIMVLTPVDRKDYAQVTSALLGMTFTDASGEQVQGEQVCFILPRNNPSELPAMEMSGLEFCGNASRSFARYIAGLENPPLEEVTVSVSGCAYPLTASVDIPGERSRIRMPLPDSFTEYTADELQLSVGGTLVNMDGISHLVLRGIRADRETFDKLKDFIYNRERLDLPAFGVMFTESDSEAMTPVVYVRDVDTTYFEGSCASGTTAAACALSLHREDGLHHMVFRQPEGVLEAFVTTKKGQIASAELDGSITLSPVINVSV